MDSTDLPGKVVVITGASMGIGEAIAKIFADHGASVVLLSRDAARAEAARQRVGHVERTIALACDVRNREEIDRVIGLTLHHFQRIDVWINNAGHGILDSAGKCGYGRGPRHVRNQFVWGDGRNAGGDSSDEAAGKRKRSSIFRVWPGTFRCRIIRCTARRNLP